MLDVIIPLVGADRALEGPSETGVVRSVDRDLFWTALNGVESDQQRMCTLIEEFLARGEPTMASTRGTGGARKRAVAAPKVASTRAATKAAPAPQKATAGATPATTVKLSGIAIKTVLTNLSTLIQGVIQSNQPSVLLPGTILGTLQQPDGTPGSDLAIEVLPPPTATTTPKTSVFGETTSGSQVIATGLSDTSGDFSIPLPGGVALPPGVPLTLRVRGSSPSGVVPLTVQPNLLGPTGYLGTMQLPQKIPPIPPAIFQELSNATSSNAGPNGGCNCSDPSVPTVTLGDDSTDCIRVLENQTSFDQYPYGIYFQLIAPNLYAETETLPRRQTGVYQQPIRSDIPLARSNLSGPISIDDFRQGLLTGPAIVGSLGLGYVLRCSQKWQFQGLALGDLVYSLPLAPGEQQQVVIEEQSTTLAVEDTEAVYGAASSQASALSDSSTQATFNAAFQQSAQGGSNFNTASQSGSMTAGGGLLGILGGPSGSLGETTSSGSSSNWMDGLQNYASTASQSVQNYAEQQSFSQRRAQRTAMRMASSSESTSVTTKTISNHNKLHALTMQYFEVLRLFDVSTSYDAVSLVCLVPLDIVWFLPPGQAEHLDDVISDSDLSNAIQYSSQLNSGLPSISSQVQNAIGFVGIGLFSGLGDAIVANVAAQLTAAVNEATQLNGILSGLTSNPIYIAPAAEANTVLSQITQAQSSIQHFTTSNSVSDLQTALSLFQSCGALATALYQQLSSPSLSGSLNREQVLDRYAGLLAHSDVLQQSLPRQYASGLTRLEKFASDPRASLVLDSTAEDVIQFSANASVLPFDHIYVAAVTRWGTRLGPVEMVQTPPVTVPGQFDPSKAFKTSDDLMQYLLGQRNPSSGSNAALQASIALPRSLSPCDVVGFEITRGMDSFTYQLATPLDLFTSFFGTNGSAWPSEVLGGLGALLEPPVAPAATTYTAAELAAQLGAPYFWNFSASLTASVSGNPENYVSPGAGNVELPAGVYPIPAMEVAPLLKYSDLILIENTLQHVLRNMVRYSKAVWLSLTPEERVMLLEPYLLSFPALSSSVPLLDCVGNEVLGFQGNCMIMPFSIPPSLGDQQGWPMTTGEIEDALLRFYWQSAPHEVTRTALPTRGVLGEAMLGNCPSGEKIDLTRFWNWQDSPPDSAPAISTVNVPGSQVSTLSTAQTPNALSGMLPSLVNNVQVPSEQANTSLLQGLITAVLAQKGVDPSSVTGASQLATLLQGAQNAGNSARASQLQANTALTSQAISTLGTIVTGGGSGGSGGKGGGSGSGGGSDGSGGGGGSDGGSSGGSGGDALAALIPVILAALA
jgi:hypothetical protein